MRRGVGVAAICAAAVLGVTAAVFTGTLTGAIGESTAGASTTGPPSTSATTPATTSSTTPATTTGASATPTGSTSPPTTTSPPVTPPATTSATPTGQLRTKNLLQENDFAGVGWNTTTLETTLSEGGGQSVVGMCSAGELGQLEGAGAPVRGDYQGKVTSAEEIAVTFADEAASAAAFDTVHRWLSECRLGAAPSSGHTISVGPDVPLDLDDAHDHGVWADTDDPEGGVSGVMGIVVVANRLAVVQVFDAAPKSTTINAIMGAAAKRLSPEITG